MASPMLISVACCLSINAVLGAYISSSGTTTDSSSTGNTTHNNSSNNTTDNDTYNYYDWAYGILLDAGSSSTKLKIYTWDTLDSSPGIPLVTLVPIDKKRFRPGLATLEGDVVGMRAYLTEILSVAQDNIPSKYHAKTPVYVLATAGFRLLGIEDAQEGMDQVEEILLDTTVHPFVYHKGRANVISGEEEGVYAWITLNYLLGFFYENRPAKESAGILEMGGASTQIAFVPHDPLLAEEFQVILAGKKYSLYVQSYLHFGLSAIEDRVVEILLAQQQSDVIQNPCMLRGDEVYLDVSENLTVMLNGTGDPAGCQAIFDGLVASAPPEKCYLEPCAIGSIFQPPVDGIDFYATQAYTYALNGVGAVLENSTLDLANLWDKAVEHCQKNITEIPPGKRRYASSDCTDAIYMNSLLTRPYGFKKDSKQITVARKIDGEDIDWAFGAMLEFFSRTRNPAHCSVTRRR